MQFNNLINSNAHIYFAKINHVTNCATNAYNVYNVFTYDKLL